MWKSCCWITLAILAVTFKQCSFKTLPVTTNPFVQDPGGSNGTQRGLIETTTPDPPQVSTIQDPLEYTTTSVLCDSNTNCGPLEDDTTNGLPEYGSTVNPTFYPEMHETFLGPLEYEASTRDPLHGDSTSGPQRLYTGKDSAAVTDVVTHEGDHADTNDPSYVTEYPTQLETDDYFTADGFTDMPYDYMDYPQGYTDYPQGYTDYPMDYDDDENAPLNYSDAQLRYYSHLYERLVARVPGIEDKGKSVYPTPANRCVRKEYRLLSDDERTRFHNAINALKRDTSVDPNKYDSIALLHSGGNLNLAHRGPGFLGWHRIYLMIYETALQEVDPSVCLAYWDTTMEAKLHRPAHSTLWSPELLGTPNGPVVDGPFANWTTPLGGPLLREVSADGSLFTSNIIAGILSRSRQEDITSSDDIQPRFDFESFHESAHAFSGGAMKTFATAAFDPMFYLLHTFIDYVWSLFRENLKRNGVNPENFPNITDVDPLHAADAPTHFGNLTHADGFLEVLAQTVTYSPNPVCSERRPDCGSRFLTCKIKTQHCLPTKVTSHTINEATASQTTTASSPRQTTVN